MNLASHDSARDHQLEAILHAYLQAVDAGQAPDRDALLASTQSSRPSWPPSSPARKRWLVWCRAWPLLSLPCSVLPKRRR